jgi:LSD1 subclass zinc finger protein
MTCARILPANVSVELRAGERLLDGLDELEQRVLAVQCRAANCGSCRLRLPSGASAWRAASARELATLTQLAAAHGERLGCQLVLEHESEAELVLEIAD